MKLKLYNVEATKPKQDVFLRLRDDGESCILLDLVDQQGNTLGAGHLMHFFLNEEDKIYYDRIGGVSDEFVLVDSAGGIIGE